MVPGYWSTEQLGLLLGIAGELRIPVAGLLDSAVGATRSHYQGREFFHPKAVCSSRMLAFKAFDLKGWPFCNQKRNPEEVSCPMPTRYAIA